MMFSAWYRHFSNIFDQAREERWYALLIISSIVLPSSPIHFCTKSPPSTMLRTQHYMPTLEAQWSEPVDLPFPLCQPILNCSLAAVEADNDSTTYHMEAQCGAGGQPKSDLISAHTKLWWRPYMRQWSEPVDLPFPLCQPKSDLLSTHTYRVLVSLAGEEMVWAGWFALPTILNKV